MENTPRTQEHSKDITTKVVEPTAASVKTGADVGKVGTELGKERMIFTPFLLGIVTLGIYQIVWLYKIHNEMLNHTGDLSIKPGMAIGLLFIPIVNLFWAIYLVFHVPGLIKQMEMQCGIPMAEQTNAGLIGVVGIVPIVGSLFWAALVQNALNRHWRYHVERHYTNLNNS